MGKYDFMNIHQLNQFIGAGFNIPIQLVLGANHEFCIYDTERRTLIGTVSALDMMTSTLQYHLINDAIQTYHDLLVIWSGKRNIIWS